MYNWRRLMICVGLLTIVVQCGRCIKISNYFRQFENKMVEKPFQEIYIDASTEMTLPSPHQNPKFDTRRLDLKRNPTRCNICKSSSDHKNADTLRLTVSQNRRTAIVHNECDPLTEMTDSGRQLQWPKLRILNWNLKESEVKPDKVIISSQSDLNLSDGSFIIAGKLIKSELLDDMNDEKKIYELVKKEYDEEGNSVLRNQNQRNTINERKLKRALNRKDKLFQSSQNKRKSTHGPVLGRKNFVNTDVVYEGEDSNRQSIHTEPTDYMLSSSRNGFIPVTGPFGNSGYYNRPTRITYPSSRLETQTSQDYPVRDYPIQSKIGTSSYYKTGPRSRGIMGSGNFEILRGGTFSDGDDFNYQQDDALYERDAFHNQVLGFQGFNHFSSPLHGSLSKVIPRGVSNERRY